MIRELEDLKQEVKHNNMVGRDTYLIVEILDQLEKRSRGVGYQQKHEADPYQIDLPFPGENNETTFKL